MSLHKNLVDPELHEPKGISSAPSGSIYISDGSGSGVWSSAILSLHASTHTQGSTDPIEITFDQVQGLTTAFDSVVPITTRILTGSGILGGGELSDDITLTLNFGNTTGSACEGNDTRLSDYRFPTGTAGGFLSGSYPSPILNPSAIIPTTQVQNLSNNISYLRANGSTGLKCGGYISINSSSSSKFDISSGSGFIIDPYTLIETSVEWPDLQALETPYLTTNDFSNVTIDISGNIVCFPESIDNSQRRDTILLGWVDHADRETLDYASSQPEYMCGVIQQLNDYFEAFGAFNCDGNIFSAYSSSLQLQKSAGSVFEHGSNYNNDVKSPHILLTDAEIPCNDLYYYYRDGNDGWINDNPSLNAVDPNHWDDNSGILAVVPADKYTIQIISLYSIMKYYDIQYGQEVYDSLAAAELDIRKSVEINPYNAYDVFRAWLVVKSGSTDLSNNLHCKFISCGKFGIDTSVGSSGGGVGGEVNTASNQGMGGIGFYLQKSGVDLQFKNIRSISSGSIITINNNVSTKTIDLNFDKTNLILSKSQISELESDLAIKVDNTRSINTSIGLSGGGDLSSNRTLAIQFGDVTGSVCEGNDIRLSNDRVANGLRTGTNIVSISASAAPTIGQVLTATSTDTATWQNLSSSISLNQTIFTNITSNVSTTSTSFVNLLSTNITTTVANSNLLIFAAGSISNTNSNINMFVRVVVDGDSKGGVELRGQGGIGIAFSIVNKIAVSAGLHTISLQWKTSSATMQCRPTINVDGESASLLIEEVCV